MAKTIREYLKKSTTDFLLVFHRPVDWFGVSLLLYMLHFASTYGTKYIDANWSISWWCKAVTVVYIVQQGYRILRMRILLCWQISSLKQIGSVVELLGFLTSLPGAERLCLLPPQVYELLLLTDLFEDIGFTGSTN